MDEHLVDELSRQINRRGFLRRIAAGVGMAIVAALGLPKGVEALYNVHCCTLCLNNNGPCSGCACSWSWTCLEGGTVWRCIECHSSTSYCGAGCTNVFCSYAQRTGLAPEAFARATG